MTSENSSQWFSYLKHLDVPQKYKISHKIIDLLLKSDKEIVESNEKLNHEDIVKHDSLTPKQRELEKLLKKLTTKESAFLVAQLEYEKKQERFIELTNYNEQSLYQVYTKEKLILRDIDEDRLLEAINSREINELIFATTDAIIIVSRDIDVFYDRIKFMMRTWSQISQELADKIQRFEYRGLKVVSSNLRVKLLPQIKELKQELNREKFDDESLSRVEIEIQINDMVEQAREDIYGELTTSQTELLKTINSNLKAYELIEMMRDPEILEDLIVLLETKKIEINLKKVIEQLI